MINVSVLYTIAGGGHLSLAQSALESLSLHYPGKYTIDLHDPFPSSYSSAHNALNNYFSDLYKFGYLATDNISVAGFISKINEIGVARKLIKYLNTLKPSLIISNHPLITAILPDICSRLTYRPKTIVHFADPFTIHSTWFVNRQADLYLSPTPDITRQAASAGIPPEKIQTIGWLTRQKFLKGPKNKTVVRESLGLDPQKTTIFVGGSGQGGPSKLVELCKKLVQNPDISEQAQAIVVSGFQPPVIKSLSKLAMQYPRFFLFFPYAPNMLELISASDLVVGKAGPNILFESVHLLRPFLATMCRPGQEEGNLKFITENDLGWVERKIDQAVAQLARLVTSPELVFHKAPSLQRVKNQHLNAPRHFAEAVNSLVRSQPARSVVPFSVPNPPLRLYLRRYLKLPV